MARLGWFLIPVAWLLAALVSSARGGMMIENGRARPMPWGEIFTGQLYDLFWWMILGPAIVLLVRRVSFSRLTTLTRSLLYCLIGIGAVAAFWILRSIIHLPGDPFRMHLNWGGLSSTVPSSASMYIMVLGGALVTVAFRRTAQREREAAELTLRAVRIARSVMTAPAMAPFKLTEQAPGPQRTSDEDIIAWVKATAETTYHPVGTCKMGVDPMAVVDPRLRVHGLQGLRVADASIMPTLTSGNTNAPSIMIGEKCARMVLADAALERAA